MLAKLVFLGCVNITYQKVWSHFVVLVAKFELRSKNATGFNCMFIYFYEVGTPKCDATLVGVHNRLLNSNCRSHPVNSK